MSQKFGTRREQAKVETRRIILETAYGLFEEVGYEKATMRELAARAGVGIGTIFQHFQNKPALLVATFDEEMRPVVANALASIPPKGLKDQLRHLVRHVFEFYARRVRLSRVLLREIIFMEGAGADKIKQLEKEYIETMAGIFAEAADRGEIRTSVNIPDAVTAFWAYYAHTLLEGLNATTFDIERQLEQMDRLADQLLSGIGPSAQ
jgi:AcrR family transcriptional regulator